MHIFIIIHLCFFIHHSLIFKMLLHINKLVVQISQTYWHLHGCSNISEIGNLPINATKNWPIIEDAYFSRSGSRFFWYCFQKLFTIWFTTSSSNGRIVLNLKSTWKLGTINFGFTCSICKYFFPFLITFRLFTSNEIPRFAD